MQEARFTRLVRIGSINAIHVGPYDKFVRVHNVSDDRAGIVGAVSAERGDAAVARGADKASYDGNETAFQQRLEHVAAEEARFLHVRLGVAEGVARENKFGRGDGDD